MIRPAKKSIFPLKFSSPLLVFHAAKINFGVVPQCPQQFLSENWDISARLIPDKKLVLFKRLPTKLHPH